METWIRRACRQRAYRHIVAWILAALCFFVVLIAMHEYWANFFNGPYEISESNAGALSSLDKSRPFAIVTGTQVVDSGVREYTTETRNGVKEKERVSSAFSVLVVGTNLLVVKGNASMTATGELKPLPSTMLALMFPEERDASLKDKIYPVMLDTTENYRLPGYCVIAATLVFAFLFWVFFRRAWGYAQNILSHPVVKRVEGWADALEIIALSEREMSAPKFKGDGVVFTDHFVIVRGFFTFNLLAWNHLLWGYQKQTTTRYYGIVPIARSQDAVFHFYGGTVTWRAGKKAVEEVLAFANERAPFAVFGYTAELEKLWLKKTSDFTAAVDARRREMLAHYSE